MLKWLRVLLLCALALLFLSGCITPKKSESSKSGFDFQIRGLGEVLEDFDDKMPTFRSGESLFPGMGITQKNHNKPK